MTRPRYSFRPNLQNADHRQAWALLQAVPEGGKSAFLVLREELKTVPSQPVRQPEEAIPQEMMGFLGSLLEE